jgi:hypothetical protein
MRTKSQNVKGVNLKAVCDLESYLLFLRSTQIQRHESVTFYYSNFQIKRKLVVVL